MTEQTIERYCNQMAHRLAMLDGRPDTIMRAAVPVLVKGFADAGYGLDSIARHTQAVLDEFARIVNTCEPLPLSLQ